MGAKRMIFFGIFLAVFSMVMTVFSQGNRRTVKEDSSQDIDENTAEQVWICCRKELGEITKPFKDYKLHINDNSKLSRKTLVHNGITDLPPQLKRSLLLSFISKRSQSRVSDGCRECLSELYSRNIHPRKPPKRRHYQRKRSHPHGSLGPSQKDSLRLEKTVIRRDLKHQKKPPDHVILIGIVVSTALATLALFVLLLFCCLGGDERKIGSECAEEDEKPIVDICPGRISGSLQTSEAVEDNKDLINPSNTSVNAAYQTSEVGKLPLPPGRTAPPPPQAQPAPPVAPPKPPAPKAPPPPPPRNGARPPNPPKPGNMKRPPGPPQGQSTSGDDNDRSGSSDNAKTKLKPLFWDKMNASPNQAMVWNEIKAGSFQLGS